MSNRSATVIISRIGLSLFGLMLGVGAEVLKRPIGESPQWKFVEEHWEFPVVGLAIGVFSFPLWRILSRAMADDWRLEEVEIEGFKFTANDEQRKAARRIFFELASRIATRPMADSDGDDGAALKSLYTTLGNMRDIVGSVEPPRSFGGETIDSFTLRLINDDLSPFLSRWHVRWDAWKAANDKAKSDAWPEHLEFRADLRRLQVTLRSRAFVVAELGEVKDAAFLLPAENPPAAPGA